MSRDSFPSTENEETICQREPMGSISGETAGISNIKSEDGWKEHGTGSSDYKEAKDKKAQFLTDLKQNKLPNERGNWTLKQAVDDGKESRKLRLQPGSCASEVSICTNLIANLKQETKLKNLTTAFTRY